MIGERKLSHIRVFTLAAILLLFAEAGWAFENKSRVVSPYWQSDSTSFSFIAVTHPSLTHSASQIGFVLNAIQKDNTAYGTAVTFTISAGTTQRIFIVRTNQATVNPTRISTASFIVGTTGFQHGHIRIDPVASNPEVVTSATSGDGHQDVTMLSYWGAVIIDANTTGFAMEFIGDVQDSTAITNMDDTANVSGLN